MRWLLIAPVIVALCACDEGTTEVEEPNDRVCPSGGPEMAPDLVVVADSLAFRAETNVVGGTPPKIRTTVTMTNISGREIETEWWLACQVWIRAYCGPRRRSLAWDLIEFYGGGCPGAALPIVLPPGQSEVLQSEVWVSHVLGDSLLPGRYFFAAALDYSLMVESPSVGPHRYFEMPAGSAEIQ
jgi:hypothetical protein